MNDPKAAGVEMQFSARILIVASVPLAVGGVMLAEPMLVWFVGDGYGRAVLPFMLLMPLLPIRVVNNLAANALSALNLQSLRTRGSLYAALVNVAANLAVVPFYGALGAAATTIVTDFLLLIYFAARLAPRIQGVRLAPTFVRLIVPTLGMAAAVWATPTWHVLLRVLAGAVVYGLGSYAFRAWQLRDLRTLRSL